MPNETETRASAAAALRSEVQRFRAAAAALPSKAFEYTLWEINHLAREMGDLRAAGLVFLRAAPPGSWSADEAADWLYALARDNDSTMLSQEAARGVDDLLEVVRLALAGGEADARWQLAARLGEVSSRAAEAEALLLVLADDEDEYVRRRALGALAALDSGGAEALAEREWARAEHPWARMGALDALARLGSRKLEDYLRRALADGWEEVRVFARKLAGG